MPFHLELSIWLLFQREIRQHESQGSFQIASQYVLSMFYLWSSEKDIKVAKGEEIFKVVQELHVRLCK